MTFNPQLKIAIIGAGLSGLAAARTLEQNQIECTIFELEESATSRNQGGTLDVHPESGQHALKSNKLWDVIRAKIRYEGQDTVIADKTGKKWLEEKKEATEATGGYDRPEVDRGVLRQTYIDSLAPGTIRWGVKVNHIIPADPNTNSTRPQHTLVLDDGSKEEYDFLVGADGAWSRVRTLLSPATPMYSGVTMIETRLNNVDQDHPHASQLVGHGSLFVLSDNKALMCQRNGDGTIRTYITLRVPEPTRDAPLPETFTNRALILEQFQDWHDDYMDIVRHSNGLIPRAIYYLPPAHTWTSHPGLTLIGDAAHLMSPYAGEGANLALIDGLELGQMIACVLNDHSSSSWASLQKELAQAQQTFETKMLARSRVSAELSAANIDIFIHPDAPAITMQVIQKLLSGPPH
ncbi:hypothetical protein BGZ94_002849 [Podila epigama]|nr:hypothetical protein BGZ94_002849 [Podila epigama]